jgi:hypothetical protein
MQHHFIHLISFVSESFSNTIFQFQQCISQSPLLTIKLESLKLLKGMKHICIVIYTYFELKYQLHFRSLVEVVK